MCTIKINISKANTLLLNFNQLEWYLTICNCNASLDSKKHEGKKIIGDVFASTVSGMKMCSTVQNITLLMLSTSSVTPATEVITCLLTLPPACPVCDCQLESWYTFSLAAQTYFTALICHGAVSCWGQILMWTACRLVEIPKLPQIGWLHAR